MTALLCARGLCVSFGGLRAVDDVSFDVEPGEILAVVGPNGAGKTTLFNLISRVCDPDRGSVVLEGRDITRIAPHDVVRAGVSRTFQNPSLMEHASVLDNLMLGRYRHHSSRLWQQLLYTPAARRERVEDRRAVETLIDFLDLGKSRDTVVAELPHGVRKVVELGRALAARPRLVLLDEPSSGLGAEERREMGFWIRDARDEMDVTVMLIEHDLALVSAVSERVMAMDSGRVLGMGTAAEAERSLAALGAGG